MEGGYQWGSGHMPSLYLKETSIPTIYAGNLFKMCYLLTSWMKNAHQNCNTVFI